VAHSRASSDSADPLLELVGSRTDALIHRIESDVPDARRAGIGALLALKASSQAIDAAVDAYFAEVGVSAPRFHVLLVLAASDRPLAMSELSVLIFTTKTNITVLIDGLERHGYVNRVAHPSDRRSVLVDLTDAGRTFVDAHRGATLRWLGNAASDLHDDEIETLVRLLGRMTHGFSAAAHRDSGARSGA
jgi:DNA-binding MarR family transcriptional regulator